MLVLMAKHLRVLMFRVTQCYFSEIWRTGFRADAVVIQVVFNCKERIYPISNIGEECVFLNSEEDESVRELCNSVFVIKCGKSNSFMFPFCSWNI